MQALHWDGSINIGNIISFGLIIWGTLKLSNKLGQIELKVDTMWSAYVNDDRAARKSRGE